MIVYSPAAVSNMLAGMLLSVAMNIIHAAAKKNFQNFILFFLEIRYTIKGFRGFRPVPLFI